MKFSSASVLSCMAAMLFTLSACTNNNEPSTTTTDSTSTDKTTTTTATTTNTIVTTQQAMLVIKHRVKDFAAWKMAYESHDSARLANGLHNYVIARGTEDSNMVMVAIKADDMTKAKAFAKDPALKERMQKGGVLGTPEIDLTTMVFQDTAKLTGTIRSMTRFSVKDWTAWEKSFKEGEQERLDNGIAVRAYGHDADDNNKVRLVTALMDTAKAHAYWKSDMLKQRRAAGGVIGEPQRFTYYVVQRY